MPLGDVRGGVCVVVRIKERRGFEGVVTPSDLNVETARIDRIPAAIGFIEGISAMQPPLLG
jgi:hypothetical protein